MRGEAADQSLPVLAEPRGGEIELQQGGAGDVVDPYASGEVEGFPDKQAFLSYCLREYTADYDSDRQNREEAILDLQFTYQDQWDAKVRADRESQGRPVLTVNTLPQFVGQVIGDRRLNETSIKVIPARDATVKGAEVRTGLIRTIERQSRANRAYNMACEDQTVCGISALQVQLDYAYNDVFEQDLMIKPFANPLAVTWDRLSVDITGRDARHCWVEEEMPRTTFERMWPDKPIPSNFSSSNFDFTIDASQWINRDTVKIMAYWHMKSKPATFAMMQDGQVEDVTGVDPIEYEHRIMIHPFTGEPVIREGERLYACRYLITSFDILEGPYELPLTRLPIIKVSGRVGRVGTKQVRFGLVRWARDPSLLRNYWRSTAAEKIAMAPKGQWIAPDDAVKGREDDFRDAHLSGDPLIIYNKNASAPPTRIPEPEVPAALLNEANMNAQDIKDVTGLHDASLGIRSNEVSGKAIMARQREGDVATVMYHDNLNESILEVGDVCNQLIPISYDTIRTVRITGANDESTMQRINDPFDEASPDLTEGKYDVAVITGPSFTTQRQEAAESMMGAVQVFPQLMEIAGDLIVKAQDWPDADKIAERLKKMLPAAANDDQEKTPEQIAEDEQKAAMAAAAQQAQIQAAELELEKLRAETEKAKAEAQQALADADKARADARKAMADADIAESQAKFDREDAPLRRAERMLDIRDRKEPPQAESRTNGSGGAPRRSARSATKKRKAQ